MDVQIFGFFKRFFFDIFSYFSDFKTILRLFDWLRFLDCLLFWQLFQIFSIFFRFFSKLQRLQLKVTEVNTEHQKWPEISKNWERLLPRKKKEQGRFMTVTRFQNTDRNHFRGIAKTF